MNIQSVIEKIQKLRKLSRSDNIHEAEAAAAAADRLIQEIRESNAPVGPRHRRRSGQHVRRGRSLSRGLGPSLTGISPKERTPHMSRWKALAYVRTVPDAELRDRLTDVTEELYEAEAEDQPSSFPELPRLADYIASLENERDAAQKEAEEEGEARALAEERLERRIDELTEEYAALKEQQAAALKEQVAIYSDCLAAARRFVSACERAKAPTEHVRRPK